MSSRKARLTTDSPTPNSGSESAPTTPTANRKRLARKLANDTLKNDKSDEKDELVKGIERLVEKKNDTSSPSRKRSGKLNEDTKLNAQMKGRKNIRSNIDSLVNNKQNKKKTNVQAAKTNRRRNSTGKLDTDPKRSARLSTDKLRSGRVRKVLLHSPSPDKVKVARKRLKLNEKTDEKSTKKAIKIEKIEVASDSELQTGRRRSDSISKCSDITDSSSFMDVPLLLLKDNDEVFSNIESQDNIEVDKIIKKELDEEGVDSIKSESDLVNEKENVNECGNQDGKINEVLVESVIKQGIINVNEMENLASVKTDNLTKENFVDSVESEVTKDLNMQMQKEEKGIPDDIRNVIHTKEFKTDFKSALPIEMLGTKNETIETVVPVLNDSGIGDSDEIQRNSKNTCHTLKEKNPKSIKNHVNKNQIKKSLRLTAKKKQNFAKMKVKPQAKTNLKSNIKKRQSLIKNFVKDSTKSNLVEKAKSVKHSITTVAMPTSSNAKILKSNTMSTDLQTISILPLSKEKGNELVGMEESNNVNTHSVSETLLEISANKFYGHSEFLENNLGIEQDPALRQIVQNHEKNKLNENNQNGDVTSTNANLISKINTNLENLLAKKPTSNTKVINKMIEMTKDNDELADVSNCSEISQNDQLVLSEDSREENIENVVNSQLDPVVIKKSVDSVTDGEAQLLNGNHELNADVSTVIENNSSIIVESIEENEKDNILSNNNGNDEENNLVSNENFSDVTSEVKVGVFPKIEEDTVEPENKENILNNFEKLSEDVKSGAEISFDDNKEKFQEPPELLEQKESHLLKLGLLSHKAAVAAKMEKQKRREIRNMQKSTEYTGTLKTVIKLRRPSIEQRKRPRESLKMTLHKARGKTLITDKETSSINVDTDSYYTIQTETDTNVETSANGGQSRKSHNRSHLSDSSTNLLEPDEITSISTGTVATTLVIPEKASSFRIHPGKLCQDQCFYCGGKFGLFDTPCHVAQIKSAERQKKILENEEKLTVDNCLCDACFRHVDRRANCTVYKKRLSAPTSLHLNQKAELAINSDGEANDCGISGNSQPMVQIQTSSTDRTQKCQVGECTESATHSVRRKWFLKMKKIITKIINPNQESGSCGSIWSICDKHYDMISHLMVCALCKRKLTRNHVYYITQDTVKLQQMLTVQGIPVIIGSSLVVCKLCRYYSNILLKPLEIKNQKMMFLKNYRRRLLQFHNIEPTLETENPVQPIEPKELKTTEQLIPKRGRQGKRQRKSSSDFQALNMPYTEVSNVLPQSTSENAMLLDNDLIGSYESSTGHESVYEPKPKKRLSNSFTSPIQQDLSILRANPNISMRQLFPGEEEMGLQINIPFSTGGMKTPEGWTKVQACIQYDEPTKHLWEELQKPYGNQSSFLRHLILLEKYFRNGDLILTENANDNAAVYSESAHQRLQSFDSRRSLNNGHSLSNIRTDKIVDSTVSYNKTSLPATQTSTSLLKVDNNSVARPRGRPPLYSKDIKSSIFLSKKEESSSTNHLDILTKEEGKGTKFPLGVPPELICINTNKVLPKSDSMLQQQSKSYHEQPEEIDSTGMDQNRSNLSKMQNVIRLPDILSPAERLEIKTWRPTLMPVTAGPPALNGLLYQTVDGRKLPNLVQVQSGGKPYLISIYDYNRMCIVRRERLLREQLIGRQQLEQSQQQASNESSLLSSVISQQKNQQSQIQQSSSSLHKQPVAQQQGHPQMQQQIQQQMQRAQQQAQRQVHLQQMQRQNQKMQQLFSAKPSNSIMDDKIKSLTALSSSTKVQIPNTILEQNSVIPINSSNSSVSISKASVLDSLLKVRKPNNSNSLLKSNLGLLSGKSGVPSSINMPETKVISITSDPNSSSSSIFNVATPLAPSSSSSSSSALSTNTTCIKQQPQSALEALFKTAQQTNASNNIWIYAEALNSTTNNGNNIGKSNSTTAIIDSSAASLLAKIPKSLTVIPQTRPSSSKSSGDDT